MTTYANLYISERENGERSNTYVDVAYRLMTRKVNNIGEKQCSFHWQNEDVLAKRMCMYHQ